MRRHLLLFSLAVTSRSGSLFALAAIAALSCAAQSPTYGILYSFKGGTDGDQPHASVTVGKDGAIYGTTLIGGANSCGSYNCGTVFALTPSSQRPWSETIIHSFTGGDGSAPNAGVTFNGEGSLFGTTETGGSGGGGTVVELTPPTVAGDPWTETTLYSFAANTNTPNTLYGGVIVGKNGNVYGTTLNSNISGGKGGGAVFMLTPPAVAGDDWTESTLLNLQGSGIGVTPNAGVVFDGGSLYSTTYYSSPSGEGGCGSVFEVTPPITTGGAWTGTTVYIFAGTPDGCGSRAGLTVGPGGVLYGTTFYDGSGPCNYMGFGGGCGTVFQLTPPATSGGAWTETVIYNFTGTNGDGAWPVGGVVLGENGVLYGTTQYGGATSGSPCSFSGVSGCGIVFSLTPPATSGGTWTETILHAFSGEEGDGAIPWSAPTLGSATVLYGTTGSGGTYGFGTVFEIRL